MDGPLSGRNLSPDRTPIMLRVAVDGRGEPRLLNGSDDIGAEESVYAYIMHGEPSRGFWDGRDTQTRKRVGGLLVNARYRLLEPQPPREDLRDNWQGWCDANKTALLAEHARGSERSS